MSNAFKKTAKYSIFFFFACMVLLNTAYAQLLIGPKLGAQLSWVNFEDDVEFVNSQPVIGYNGGFMLAFKVGERYFLQSEFIYSRKGKKYEGETDPLLDYQVVQHHFDLPIIYRVDFKGSLGQGKAFRYYAGIGPNISYWWGANGTIRSSELEEEGIFEVDFDFVFDDVDNPSIEELVVEDANRVMLGVNFAVGVVLEPQPGQSLIIDLRYEMGHSFFSDDQQPVRFQQLLDFADPLRARNNGIRLGVAYVFDTKIAERKKGKTTRKRRER